MRCKCGLFLALCFWVLLVPTVAKAKVKPKRVAVISSSGVNNDFRSWNEYDGTLQHLGWHFELEIAVWKTMQKEGLQWHG